MSNDECSGDQLADLLYSSNPAIVLSKYDMHVSAQLQAATEMTILFFEDHVPGLTVLNGGGATLRDLVCPPTLPCIFVACSEIGREKLSELSQWWSELGGAQAPPIEIVPEGSAPADTAVQVFRALLEAERDTNRKSSRRLAELHDQILSLREQYDESQTRVRELRSCVYPSPPEPFAVLQPAEELWCQEKEGTVAKFQFPLRAHGIARMDLNFRKVSEARGTLFVELTGNDESVALGAWKIPYDRMEAWVALEFPNALEAHDCLMTLQLRWQTIEGAAPRLSLSDEYIDLNGIGAIDDYATQTSRLPAIRFYRGIPGQMAGQSEFWTYESSNSRA